MKKILISSLLLFLNFQTFSQQYRPLSSGEILLQLKKLNTLSTAMYLAAHPDDENTRLISYLEHERNIRTVYLSLTRGDGGQNIIGKEQGPTLGLIRTLEMNEARKMDGAEQMYSSAVDFGYSKNPEEVFTFWDKQKLVDEVKTAIQAIKPDVIFLRFPTTGEGGHGQHTASAIIALEAYRQLEQEAQKNSEVWVPKRLFFNAFKFGNRSTQKEDQLQITINQYNPILGKSYGELAGQSRSMHKSQGAGTPQSFGEYREYFELLAGAEAQNDILEGIDMTWSRVGASDISSQIEKIIQQFDPQRPEGAVKSLIALHGKMVATRDNAFKEDKIQLLEKIIFSCAGITAELLAEQAAYTTGGTTINTTLNMVSSYPNTSLKSISSNDANIAKGNTQAINESLKTGQIFTKTFTLDNPYHWDNPYWLQNYSGSHHFSYNEKLSLPLNTPKHMQLLVQLGNDFSAAIELPISYKKLDPLRGDVINEIRIVPEVSIEPVSSLLFVSDKAYTTTDIHLKTNEAIEEGLLIRASNQAQPKKRYVPLLKLNTVRNGLDTIITVKIDSELLQEGHIYYEALAPSTGKTFEYRQQVLTYDHIPETQYLEAAQQKIVNKSWTTKVKNIGYIQGADDKVDDILSALGMHITNLNWSDFQNTQLLQDLDVIIVGIRAYNVNTDIAAIQPLLMKYIQDGGTVIVQYNTNRNLKTEQLAPYPFELSRNRITRENAPTKILNPQHPLLNHPNKIETSDWDNWVQERGLYYPENWDNNYETLIQHQEFDEKPLESGILYTPYGKGHYIYTSLSFFRQLPAGNPGAIKLFMNLLSAGK